MSSSSVAVTTAIDHDQHARMRKILTPAFTLKALQRQEPLLQKSVALLIQRFQEKTGNPDGTSEPFNIIPWFNFAAFDIIGDIAYGETFDCLQTSEYHPFVELVLQSIRADAVVRSIRFFPLLNSLFTNVVYPYVLMGKQKKYGTAVIDKMNRRLGWEVSHPDIMSYVISGNEKGAMTPGEVEATFMSLTMVGSETTATTLSGLMTQLIAHPVAYQRLTSEIRGALNNESDITLEAIKDLPYLNACTNEAMRLCPAINTIPSRKVPEGGDTVCGIPIAGGVSNHLPSPIRSRSHPRRPASPS